MYLDTHPNIQTANELLVWGNLSISIGYSQSQELKKWEDELYKQMKNAAEEEKVMAISEGNLEDGVPFITVVVDVDVRTAIVRSNDVVLLKQDLINMPYHIVSTRKRHVGTDYGPNAQEALPDLPEVEIANRS
ncbi:hypothetical protein ILUMI_05466 [Ignelater luminosus]|uniref:Uncharacterized protein n=1 Tax=Ignelater luminosus TaxID=2038154 RepID=A0A8K0D724_IGNLU|nr:hypothetical protein ILUMI_05466 [Ignelater luminosus]